MKCLSCSNEMMNNFVQTNTAQITYDVCEDCGSLWLDRGELDKMAFQVDGSVEYCSKDKVEDAGEPGKDCPRCEVGLDSVTFIGSDILLDRCGNCGGFWLKGGELELINKELEETMPVKGKGFSEFVKNVYLPYWHKRIKRNSRDTDFTVDVPVIKGAERESETEYNCPGCDSKLVLYKIFGMPIEGCDKCKGVFLDKDELRKLKDKCTKGSWQALVWMDDEVEAIAGTSAIASRRVCPKCEGVRFVSATFGDSKILVDWCPKCNGIWLDRDEFGEIIEFLRSKLNKLSSGEMAKQVYEEIKEIWGGSESKVSEILDAKAAISALINITIFEHPKLFGFLTAFDKANPIR